MFSPKMSQFWKTKCLFFSERKTGDLLWCVCHIHTYQGGCHVGTILNISCWKEFVIREKKWGLTLVCVSHTHISGRVSCGDLSTDQFKIQKLALLAHTFYFYLLLRSDKIFKYLSESLISSKYMYFFQFKPCKDTLFRWLSI